MDYKKSELTKFAKEIVYVQEKLFDAMCISDEIAHGEIGTIFKNGISDELLIEISKRFAKYVKNNASVDVDNGDVQTCQDIINEVINCCEEHNWFN